MLPKVLVHYRSHSDNITSQKKNLQLENAKLVQRNLLKSYGFSASESQLETHYFINAYRRLPEGATNVKKLRQARAWLEELRQQNLQLGEFDPAEFSKILAEVHTNLFARKKSTLRLRDYLSAFTTDFASLTPRQLVRQLGHSLKNGI